MKTGAANIYPVNLTNEIIVYSGTDSNSYTQQNLPFNVTLYGSRSDRVAISPNGLLMFGSEPNNNYNQPIPSTRYLGGYTGGSDAGPVIEPLQGDLYLLSSGGDGVTSYISTGTLGTAPNLVYTVRYYRVTAYTARADKNSPIFSFDVFLYQNSSLFEMRYYRLDVPSINATNTQFPLSVGIQSYWYPYLALFSSSTNMTAISSALLGNTFTFTPIIVNVTNLDPIAPSNHSDCLSFPDPINSYNVEACPMYSGNQTVYPAKLLKETSLQYAGNDNTNTAIYLTFPVTIYGFYSNRVTINTNGLLMFGETPVTTSTNNGNRPISYSNYGNGAGPVIFPWQADLFLLSASYNIYNYISTGYLGQAPNSVFVIRFNRVASSAASGGSPPPLYSFDIFLYENSTTFEIRYYRLDLTPVNGTAISVGIQGNNAERYVALFSQSSNYTTIRSALAGNVLTFSPVAGAFPGSIHSNNDNNDSDDNNLSDGAIAGIVIGSVIGGMLLACLCLFCLFAARRGVFDDKQSQIPNKQSELTTIPKTTAAAAHSRPDVEATQTRNIEMEHV